MDIHRGESSALKQKKKLCLCLQVLILIESGLYAFGGYQVVLCHCKREHSSVIHIHINISGRLADGDGTR